MPENDETVAPVPHTFPFPVPADFATASNDDLTALSQQLADYAGPFGSRAPHEHTEDSVGALEASAALAVRIRQTMSTRLEATGAADASMSELQALGQTANTFAAANVVEQAPEVLEGTVEAAPAAVTAASGSRNPGVRQIGRSAQPTQLPAQMTAGSALATMSASADVPGFTSGQDLPTFSDAARALAARMDKYPTMTAGRAKAQMSKTGQRMRPITTYDPQGRKLEMKSYTRHGAVQFQRNFPDELRVVDGTNGYSIAEYASSERRLFGGNLMESAKNRVVTEKRGLTAAAAWCAASEVIYQLCELESLSGLLSTPELQTSRGGWQIPELGGPDFAYIWNNIGNAGDTHLSEADVQEDVAKICTEIPCPDFEDIRLGVDYVCLTGGLLQRRGYPEIVARFSRGAMVALAHKMNRGFIADLVAASGPAIVVPQIVNGDDAASAILAAVEMAIVDIKYRNRMEFGTTLEVVMPMWFLAQIRAALSRRRGVALLSVSDAEILDWFTMRRAVPQFVYDWQDAFSDLPGGPGAADPIEALPTSGLFLVYPAGTWVKAVQDVVSLDTIYDSTNLQTNQYTAIFAEDGWAPLQMCPDSRLYEVALDPSGVVGCCPPELISF